MTSSFNSCKPKSYIKIIWKLKSGDSFHLNFQRVVTTNYQVLVRREEHFPAQTGNILDNFYDFKCSRWSQWGASNPCNYLMIKIPIFILWTSVLWLSIIINYQPSFILELILQWITFGCRRRTKTWRIISTSFIDLLAVRRERVLWGWAEQHLVQEIMFLCLPPAAGPVSVSW